MITRSVASEETISETSARVGKGEISNERTRPGLSPRLSYDLPWLWKLARRDLLVGAT